MITPITVVLRYVVAALWFHNVLNEEWGVAVNVFWRHLAEKHYDAKDVYGNRDVVQYTRASQCLERAMTHLRELPAVYADFYARRLVQKLETKVYVSAADEKSSTNNESCDDCDKKTKECT